MTLHPASTVVPDRLDSDQIETRLVFACQLVRQAGQSARRAWQDGNLAVEQKGLQDFVTAIDRQTETYIRNELKETFPGDDVLGEEFGGGRTNGPLWVVDPIDGTSNFIRGLSDWAVSLALVDQDQLILGIIYDGGRDLLYWGRSGRGAFCEGNALSAARTDTTQTALVMLGTNQQTPIETHLADIRALRAVGAEYRRHGSAVTGLLMVADGRVDAYYEHHLNAWDALAGLCLAKEVGAVIQYPAMDSFLQNGGQVFCATQDLALLLQETLAPVADRDT